MKKNTLKILEEELNANESFIDYISKAIKIENYDSEFFCEANKKRINYDELMAMDAARRLEIISDPGFLDGVIPREDGLYRSMIILYIMGFKELSFSVFKMEMEHYTVIPAYEKIADIKRQIEQRKINSKGGKGRTSCHKVSALKIALDTWEKIPGASMESLSVKIHEYLNNKYRGVPQPGTIKSWLKSSGLNPCQSPKIRDYELVIK
ncbi:hypothetical protein ACOGYV_001234 [Edwardsiella piscicida]